MFRRSATKLFSPLRTRTFPSSSSFCSQEANVGLVVTPTGTSIVKPSSPTPRHLAEFKLSLMDNLVPPMYVPFVFFYPPPPPGHGGCRLEILKSSLAHALTRLYPLAGRLSSSSGNGSVPVVECNDEGVPFSSAAAVGSSLTSFLYSSEGAPETDSLRQFLPFPAYQIRTAEGVETAPQVAFRATVFGCCGVALGVCVLHKIIDGHTLADFMKLWAAFARSSAAAGGGAYAHDRAATSLFPARRGDAAPSAAEFAREEVKDVVTRRFVFDGEATAALKVRARSGQVPNPSRSEAISGLLWKSAVNAAATALSSDDGKLLSIAVTPIDLRPRMKEPWADYAVGNVLWSATSLYDDYQRIDHSCSDGGAKILQQLVHKLRSSIAKVDKDFVAKLEGGAGREEFLRGEELKWKMMASASESGSKLMWFPISSTIGLGLYDVDFGWGRPLWIGMAEYGHQMKNVALLIDSTSGYGAETWITMPQQEMAILEQDPELLLYAKKNPKLL